MMFDPKSVTAVFLDSGIGPDEVSVVVPGKTIFFRDEYAEAVRAYFLALPINDLMRPADDPPGPVALYHGDKDC